jgi:hypothetical protein
MEEVPEEGADRVEWVPPAPLDMRVGVGVAAGVVAVPGSSPGAGARWARWARRGPGKRARERTGPEAPVAAATTTTVPASADPTGVLTPGVVPEGIWVAPAPPELETRPSGSAAVVTTKLPRNTPT